MTENTRPEEATARLILSRLHGPDTAAAEDIAVALEQVDRDPEGARILALDEPIPRERADLRLARSRGIYVLPATSDGAS